jgi:putative glycosyltransferase (TIGR04372 family)
MCSPSNPDAILLLGRCGARLSRSLEVVNLSRWWVVVGSRASMKEVYELAQHMIKSSYFDVAHKLLTRILTIRPDYDDAHLALATARAGLVVAAGGTGYNDKLPKFPDFTLMHVSSHNENVEPEHAPPFRIFVQLTTLAFAGFISANVYAATIKRQYKNAHLTVFYRKDRPYKDDIIQMNPYIDSVITAPDDQPMSLDYFERDYLLDRRPVANRNMEWYGAGRHMVNLMITSSMMHDIHLLSFETPAKLRVPDDRTDHLTRELVQLGLDPNRWFCTLHYREASYKGANWIRDGDPQKFETVSNQIIDDLGGQVVRVGHPGMAPFQKRPGFVDLSEHSTIMQAFAVSRSRFMITSASGATYLAFAFDVPVLSVDSPDVWTGWSTSNHLLFQHIFTPDRAYIPVDTALENGLYSSQAIDYLAKELGYYIVPNSSDEIVEAINVINGANSNVKAWRIPTDEPASSPPDHTIWPPKIGPRPWDILKFPNLVPKI